MTATVPEVVYAIALTLEVERDKNWKITKILSQKPRGITSLSYATCVKMMANSRFEGDENKAHAILSRQLSYGGSFPKQCAAAEAGALTWLGEVDVTFQPGSKLGAGKDAAERPLEPIVVGEQGLSIKGSPTIASSYILINPVYYQKIMQDFMKTA
jgi:hypothetical protein